MGSVGKTLSVGDEVAITLLVVKDGEVRVGIGVPKNMSVYRQEIYQIIKRGERSSVSILRCNTRSHATFLDKEGK
ncbi:MAG: carbon storage regulator [Gammaproteobacteria bacterium]|nr:carbon storage regulator [Gammaproteobacteria bacterium]